MSWQPGQFGSKKVSSNFLHCQKKNKKLTTWCLHFKIIVLEFYGREFKGPSLTFRVICRDMLI